jgi:hypothetical protein
MVMATSYPPSATCTASGGSQHVRGVLGEGNLPAQSILGAVGSPDEGKRNTWVAWNAHALHGGGSSSKRAQLGAVPWGLHVKLAPYHSG